MLDIDKYFINNINVLYVNRYKKFIEGIDNKGKRNLDYKEKHHIVPRCINIDLYKDMNNIIELTAREHFIAHKILSKCFIEGTNEYNRLVCALFAMSKLKMKFHNRDDIKLTSKEYEKLRIRYSKIRQSIMRNNIKDPKYKNFTTKGKSPLNKGKISITNGVINRYVDKESIIPNGWYKGNTQKKKGEEWKQHLKESWKKNKENRVGKNHPMYGKGYLVSGKNGSTNGLKEITDGINNIFVKPTDIDTYIKNGWKVGMTRKKKPKESFKYMYKGDICKVIDINEIENYLNDGWKVGNPKTANKGSKNGSYGKICVNNGTINKRIIPEEKDLYLSNGWILGFKKYK